MNISEILKQAEELFNKGNFEGAFNQYSAAQEKLIDEFKKINYFINSRTKRIFSEMQNVEGFEPIAEEVHEPSPSGEGEQLGQAIEEPASAEGIETAAVPEAAPEVKIAEGAAQPVEEVPPAAEAEPTAKEEESPIQSAEPTAAPAEQPAAAQDDGAKLDDVLKKLDDLDEETGGEQKTLSDETDEAELAKKSESIDNIDIDNLLKDLDLS